jgi:hypothetical protein
LIVNAAIKSQTLAAKMLRGLCVGYVVLFNSWFAVACVAMSCESFYPRYRVLQIASGLKSAAFALMFLVIALGVAFGHRVPTQRGDDCRCVFAGHFDQDGKTRMSFHQGCDVTVPGAAERSPFQCPGTARSSIFAGLSQIKRASTI